MVFGNLFHLHGAVFAFAAFGPGLGRRHGGTHLYLAACVPHARCHPVGCQRNAFSLGQLTLLILPQGRCLAVQRAEGLHRLSNPGRRLPAPVPSPAVVWSAFASCILAPTQPRPLCTASLLRVPARASSWAAARPCPPRVSFPPLGAAFHGLGLPVAQDNHGLIFLCAFVFSGLFLSRVRSQRPKFLPSLLLPLGRPRDAVAAASRPPQVGAG